MRYPRRPEKPRDLAEAFRELKRLRVEVAKAEAAVAQRRSNDDMSDSEGGNESSEAP